MTELLHYCDAAAIVSRYLAGDTVAALAHDYDMARHVVEMLVAPVRGLRRAARARRTKRGGT